MDIELTKVNQFRSFKKDFKATGLNTFVILTGRNGVGKTQLLQLIDRYQFFSADDERFHVRVHVNGCTIHQDQILGIFNWQSGPAPSAGLPEISNGIANVTSAITNKLGYTDFDRLMYSHEQRNVLEKLTVKLKEQGYNNSTNAPTAELIEENLPIDFFDQSPQIFNERIAALVFDWHVARMEANDAGRVAPDPATDPILIFNQLCEEFELKYKIPAFPGLRKNYSPRLVNFEGDSIEWNELSSGEMVIIRIVCWLFYYQIEKAYYPKLMLLDEPDAHLSPAMISKVLEKIQTVIVESMGINVIMTTHSPNTVALAHENSLYELTIQDDGTHSVNKISRKQAITTFSDGLLFVETDTRLAFVEGKTDVSFYENALKISLTKHELKSIPSIKIISASKASQDHGGCEEVKKLCSKFDGTSIERLVYGLIDNDNKNKEVGNLLVLDRYAIENYLYDPVVMVGALLLQGKQALLQAIKHLETDQIKELYENPKLLQSAVNEVIRNFETIAKRPIETSQHSKKLVNQKIHVKYSKTPVEYALPEWFLRLKKSVLMKEVIRIPANNLEKYTKEKQLLLCLEAIGGVHDDILRVFSKIQEK